MIIKSIRNQQLFVLIIFLLFSFLHLFIVVLNHFNFKSFAFDYGAYNFAFYDFAHFRLSSCPVYLTQFEITFLQDHFSLTLIFLSPLYWLLSPVFGSYSLLLIQWVLIICGGWATFKYIFLKVKDLRLATLAMVFYFILYGRFSSYHTDCNLAIMGSALVPVFLYFFEKKNIYWSSFIFLILILNREDFALNMLFLSCLLYFLNKHDLKQKRFAAILALASLLSFIVIFKFVIPLFEDEHKSFSLFNYQALGKDPYQAFIFIISHPLQTLSMLVTNHTSNAANDWIKFKFYAVYIISGGFLLFYRPVYLIALIPLIAKKMFNDESFRWSHEGYYGVEIASVLPILVFSVIADLSSVKRRFALGLSVLLLTTGVTVYCMYNSTSFYYGFNKFNLLSDSFYVSDFDVKTLNSVLNEIPDTAMVSASNRVLPHLAFRKKIFFFPQVNEADYVCVSLNDFQYPLSKEDLNTRIQELKDSGDWKIVREEKDAVLLKRLQY